MQQEIKCPNCGNLFEPTDAIREEVEKELRIKMQDWQKKENCPAKRTGVFKKRTGVKKQRAGTGN